MAFIIHFIPGYLRKTSSVTDRPTIYLSPWRIIKILDSDGTVARHLVGRDQREGRVSSGVESINIVDLTATTSTGRTYTLGEPGFDSDAEWVLGRWLRINNCKVIKDQTYAVLRLHRRVVKARTKTKTLSHEMLALNEAYSLMQDLRVAKNLPEDIRHELTYCLRHFPEISGGKVDFWTATKGGIA